MESKAAVKDQPLREIYVPSREEILGNHALQPFCWQPKSAISDHLASGCLPRIQLVAILHELVVEHPRSLIDVDLAEAAIVAVGQQMVVAGGRLGQRGMDEGEENPDLEKDVVDKENTLVQRYLRFDRLQRVFKLKRPRSLLR